MQKALQVIKSQFGRGRGESGFSLVEIILASALLGILATGVVGALVYGVQTASVAGSRERALLIAEEGLAATQNIRDAAFANLTDGNHGIAISGNQWAFSGTSDVTDIFTRQVVVSTVNSTKKQITSTVTWQQDAQRAGSVSAVTYLTDWLATGTPPIGDWSVPSQVTGRDPLGNNDGLKVAVQGNYAYLVRNDGGPDFVIYDLSVLPAAPTQVGSLSLSGAPVNIFVSGSYAYVTTSDNAAELRIINISTPASPVITGTYNAVNNADGSGIYVVGTTAYMTRLSSGDPEFYVINVATPASPTLTGSLELGSDGREVYVSGTNAFVASADNAGEMKVVNITTPASPTLTTSLNLAGNGDGISITGFGTNVLLGRTATNEMDIISVATPASPTLTSTFSTSAAVNDIALGNSNTYAFLGTSDNAAEFKVVNIATLGSPVLLGSLNLSPNNNLLGIAYDSTLDRAFGAGDSNTLEFVVIKPN